MRIRTIIAMTALATLTALGTLLSGCMAVDQIFCAPHCRSETHNSSSLVSFLYPEGSAPPLEDAIPELHLPLRVGLAFLPSQHGGRGELDEAQKEQILERIRARFADRKFVAEIVIVPDYYLTGARGFDGLQGVQRLYNIDLMALVSYDQVTHLDDNRWSLTYLTIIGAYVIPGSSHDVATLVDLAVVDPATRSLVLRAGGTDTRHQSSTLVDLDRDARTASAASFGIASQHMINNFDAALGQFEAAVKAGRANVRVVNRSAENGGKSGGGALGVWELSILFAFVVLRRVSVTRMTGIT
jgi:rhombotail lipoprotein